MKKWYVLSYDAMEEEYSCGDVSDDVIKFLLANHAIDLEAYTRFTVHFSIDTCNPKKKLELLYDLFRGLFPSHFFSIDILEDNTRFLRPSRLKSQLEIDFQIQVHFLKSQLESIRANKSISHS